MSPRFCGTPATGRIFEQSLKILLQARDKARKAERKLELALYVYFGDSAAIYEKLVELPVDIVGIDFTCGTGLIDTIASSGSPKPLALGLVDGRKQHMEDPAEVARQVERLFPRIQGGRAYLGPSCGVEYLSSDAAFAKFALLPKVLAELNG